MKFKKKPESTDLCFSQVFGSGIYAWDGDSMQDPLCGDGGRGCKSPTLTNVITGERFFMKRYGGSEEALEQFKAHILLPPLTDRIFWPRDVIVLSKQQRDYCSLFVDQEYTENPTSAAERRDSIAFLFPVSGYPKVRSAERLLAGIPEFSWKDPTVRKMILAISETLESVNRSGYLYGDFHLSRIYFTDDFRAILDFSGLVYPVADTLSQSPADQITLPKKNYPIEFADPAVIRDLIPNFDINSQNFSLCALLFYLMMGRHAYDGSLLDGYVDDSPMTHYAKFRDYHKMPVFIFDTQDEQNHLGTFYEEQKILELWEELPEKLKRLFRQTLAQKNAERTEIPNNPTASTWLKAFRSLGWNHENEDKGAEK